MTNQISNELRDYLQSWLDWVEDGAPHEKPYSRVLGLCNNVENYSKVDLFSTKGITKTDLNIELCSMFNDATYPFGTANYSYRAFAAIQHLDEERIAWVKEQLK